MTIPASFWSLAKVLGHLARGVHQPSSFLSWLTLLLLSSHVRNGIEVMEVIRQRKRTPRGGHLVIGVIIDGSVAEGHTFPQVWSVMQPEE